MSDTSFWSSRTMFILAVVGSAIGLGNLWRFPYVAYENGGGAFLIPYLIALLTAGIPLLILETGVGYKTRAGAPLAFKRLIGRGTEVIGWIAVFVAFLIVTYYAVIIAWGIDYIGFSALLSWGSDPGSFFFNSFLNVSSGPFDLGSFNWMILLGSLIAWIAIYFAIFKGVRSVEKMIWFTVTVPWFFILVFVIRGVTLPGAWDGLAWYLTPDFSRILDPDVWLAAYGQIFYSLSLAMAIIIAYSRFLGEKQDVVKTGVIIAVANSLTSIFAGLAVFSGLGYLAHINGVPVTEVVSSGIGLVFVTYPAVISALPVLPELFGIIFFLMLVLLGIDSAFSLVEASSAGLIDYVKKPAWMVSGIVCIAAFAVGLIYTMQGGLYWLDIVDHYINNFLIIIVGLGEAIIVGYIYGPTKLREFINKFSDWQIGGWWDICIKFVVPLFLIIALLMNLLERIGTPYGDYSVLANAVGWGIVIIVPILSVIIAYALRNTEGGIMEENAEV